MLLLAPAAHALDALQLDLGSIALAGGSAGRVALRVDGAGRAQLLVEELTLPAPAPPLRRLRLDCRRGDWHAGGYRCAQGRLRVDAQGLGEVAADARFALSAAGGSLDIGPMTVAGGTLKLVASWHGEDWTLRVAGDGVGVGGWHLLPAIALGEGRVNLDLDAAGHGGELDSGQLRVGVDRLAFSDPSGLRAAEGVGVRLEAELADRRVRFEASAAAGDVFFDPLFVSFAETPLAVRARGEFDPATRHAMLDRLSIEQRGVATARGHLDIGPGGVGDGEFTLARGDLAPLFRRYLAPLLAGTAFARLAARGKLAARVAIAGGRIAGFDADATGIEVDDGDGQIELRDVAARLRWRDRGPAPRSTLEVGGGRVLRLPFGGFTLRGAAVGDDFSLAERVRIPLFDGGIVVDRLEVGGFASGAPEWQIGARLLPVSLARLGPALGWPPFGGSLAVSTPQITVRDDAIVVDGTLGAEVFGGRITLSSVRLASPFGVVPRFAADAEIHDIDLELLTRAFSFGRIEGRIGGKVSGLVLERWRPVALDLRLATPAGDRSRHRISQRAVDNLASIGGAGAVLSSTFMRFFEQFSYRRIGLACRLANGICRMDGVAPAGRGFYIVEGGGLPPRIDIIGHNREVDWNTLIERLRAVTAAEAPVVR